MVVREVSTNRFTSTDSDRPPKRSSIHPVAIRVARITVTVKTTPIRGKAMRRGPQREIRHEQGRGGLALG